MKLQLFLGVVAILVFLLIFSRERNMAETLASKENTETDRGAHLLSINPDAINWKEKDDAYWRSVLTPKQYEVTRQQGTERAGTGHYDKFYEAGTYYCSSCGQKLFASETKFNSGTGWPSFYDALPGAVELHRDSTFGMARTEVLCSRCGAHLGHVFDDGPNPTGKRYCMNSVSLLHEKEKLKTPPP